MQSQRKVVLYIACSLDGYIAKPGDDLSFLSIVQKEGEDYGYAEFSKTVDTVIMGRKTFDWVFREIGGTPHPDKETFILTRTARPDIGKTKFYTGDLKDLILQLKSYEGRNIYCDGGAEIVDALLRERLLDECIVSIIPMLLGSGVKLFKDGIPEQRMKLLSARSFDTGLVQLHYQFVENP